VRHLDIDLPLRNNHVLTAFLRRLNAKSPLPKPVALGTTDSLKVAFTAKDNGKGKRPHQAFVILKDQDSGLEAPFPLNTKDNGKAVVQIVRLSYAYLKAVLWLLTSSCEVPKGNPRAAAGLQQATQGLNRHRLLRLCPGLRRACF